MTSTKKYTIFLFVVFSIVVVYALIMMAVLHDISQLSEITTPLIGAVVTYAVYCAKSATDHKNGVFDGHFDEEEGEG